MTIDTNADIHEPDANEPIVDSRQRILNIAEDLFMQHGYRAVSLRDIADALSIKQASLYYHFPDGKEQLFEAVAERAFLRHKAGIDGAIAAQSNSLRNQLLAVIGWFNSQPPMNLTAMIHADMPALQPERMKSLEKTAHTALFQPILGMFASAMQRGEIKPINPANMAGLFLSVISGLQYGTSQVEISQRPAIVAEVVDVLLQGVYPR